MTIKSKAGRTATVLLDLVGITVDFPECFSGKAPCLADALQLDSSIRGKGRLRAQGSTTRCAVVGKLGNYPLLFGELSGYKELSFDVLNPDYFAKDSGLVQVVLSFQFGAEVEKSRASYAWCDVVIGHCVMGLGPKSAGLVRVANAGRLEFDKPLWHEAHVRVTSVLNDRIALHVEDDLPANAPGIDVPPGDVRRIARHGCRITLMANGLFGPDEEYPYIIDVKGTVNDAR